MPHFPLGAILMFPALACLGQAPVEIYGEYIEGRSNHVFGCYCEWSGEMVTGGTEAVLAWQIRSGAYRGVPLAGARIAAVISGERSLSIGQAPRKSILVVDAAGTEQRQAADHFARQRYGALLGEIRRVEPLPIEFRITSGEALVRIADLVTVQMRKARLPEDALQGALLWYPPFLPMVESNYGITLRSKYSGDDFGYRWETNSDFGVTGYFGTFRARPE